MTQLKRLNTRVTCWQFREKRDEIDTNVKVEAIEYFPSIFGPVTDDQKDYVAAIKYEIWKG